MKKKLHNAIILVLLIFISNTAFSQTEISNKIVDFLTLAPIESASIYVQGSTVGTISNQDGKFVLSVPEKYSNDTLVVSSIGYRSFKSVVSEFDASMDIFLEEDIAPLDEVMIVATNRPTTANDIVLRAIEEMPNNLPEQPYLQKGFLRHKERNVKEYKWLIESALTLYDSSYAAGAEDNLKINIDENRKSYDLRDVDSLFVYAAYLKDRSPNFELKSKSLVRDTIATASLIKAIKWNDERVNGLDNLFKGRLNIMRNSNMSKALFGEDVLNKHQFKLDTILVENERKIYKIEITKGKDYVGLNTDRVYNEGFEPKGWLYIYWDNYAVKKIEYELKAASDKQKARSKSLFGTLDMHKLIITYKEYQEKMYPNYYYYEAPKLVNAGDRSSDRKRKTDEEKRKEREEQFYFTVQEILFTEIIEDPLEIKTALAKDWSNDIFVARPYNKSFWKNYNVLLESEQEEQLIRDLSQRASLFKQ